MKTTAEALAEIEAKKAAQRSANAKAKLDAEAEAARKRAEGLAAVEAALPALQKQRESLAALTLAILEPARSLFEAWGRTNRLRAEVGQPPLTEEWLFAPLAIALNEKYPGQASGLARMFKPEHAATSMRFNAETGRGPNIFDLLSKFSREIEAGAALPPSHVDYQRRLLEIHANAHSRGAAEDALAKLEKETNPPAPPPPPMGPRPGEVRPLFSDSIKTLGPHPYDDAG